MRENKEHWRELAKQAETEQDPDKLLELTKEINRLLEEKFARIVKEDLAKSKNKPQ